MKKIFLFSLFLFFIKNTNAQHQDVFPALTGDVLLENLVNTYKLLAFPNQSNNRDTLFAIIDNINDSLACVYTNYKIKLDPNQDPTQDAFNKGINTEHTYPKSLYAGGFADGDIHHLHPAREDVNNDRGNLPFAEIPDNETENWYYLSQELSSIPTSNIDLYSERKDGAFEPQEARKGDVARAMMYFYTMYKDSADVANPNYFENQRETFCAWHFLDPVDQAEWDRTWKIAEYQEGKPNPFVLDCTLPERSYCQDFGQNCTTNTFSKNGETTIFSFDKITPNPIQGGVNFYFNSKYAGNLFLEIYDLNGIQLEYLNVGFINAGKNNFYWENINELPQGMVICQLILKTNKKEIRTFKKAVVVK